MSMNAPGITVLMLHLPSAVGSHVCNNKNRVPFRQQQPKCLECFAS